jgi:hypothetical protein
VATPLLVGLDISIKSQLVIAFMEHLHGKGQRGSCLKSEVSRTKQSMLLRGGDIKCFSTPIVLQAMKACRYTTAELKTALLKQRESNRCAIIIGRWNLVVSIPRNVICADCICAWSLDLILVKGSVTSRIDAACLTRITAFAPTISPLSSHLRICIPEPQC